MRSIIQFVYAHACVVVQPVREEESSVTRLVAVVDSRVQKEARYMCVKSANDKCMLLATWCVFVFMVEGGGGLHTCMTTFSSTRTFHLPQLRIFHGLLNLLQDIWHV